MIGERLRAANSWSPSRFERFQEHYPATAWTMPPAHLDRSDDFAAEWSASNGHRVPPSEAVVLTPGLFAEWLPTCFRDTRRAFSADGHRVLRTPTRTSLGIRAQARLLTERILVWLRPDERFVWCAHSKGGVDALWSLEASAELRARCVGAVVVQPPVGPSRLVDRWLGAPRTLIERSRGFLLRRRAFSGGARDISSERDALASDWLAGYAPVVPTLHAVSWSTRATHWVDSYHEQLSLLEPGHAHDGQFYLGDQRLPATPIVCLAELDHAQPVLGGGGLDAGRLWRTLVALLPR